MKENLKKENVMDMEYIIMKMEKYTDKEIGMLGIL